MVQNLRVFITASQTGVNLSMQISWKNLGCSLLIHDVIIIPQYSCWNALIKWPPSASLTKSLWLQMCTHIPPKVVMYLCQNPILNYIANRISIAQLCYVTTCSGILRRLRTLTNSNIFIRNTSLTNVVTVPELSVYTYDVFFTPILLWFYMFYIWAWTVLILYFNVISFMLCMLLESVLYDIFTPQDPIIKQLCWMCYPV